ncbi:MAG: DJ-1 family glyoxalase III [Rectinemataceae bacterium]
MKRACVLLADGFEEVEAVTPIDYLRRAGVDVTVVGVSGMSVTGAHGLILAADSGPEALALDYDAVVAPGGMPGAKNLAENAAVVAMIKRHHAAGRGVAAICAAPVVLLHGACGILTGRDFTGFPGTEAKVPGGHFAQGRVVRDGNLLTSRAAGTAGEFSVELVRLLLGDRAADDLASSVLLR